MRECDRAAHSRRRRARSSSAHRRAGDLLVLSTATNRYLTELTAADLGFEHLIATEPEEAGGVFTGRIARHAEHARRQGPRACSDWLDVRWHARPRCSATPRFYSDSINDLPLLQAVGEPVAVDPDERLLAHAISNHWRVLRLAR